MAHLTLYELGERIDRVIDDLDHKADRETIRLELELVKKDVTIAQKEIDRINGYGRWVIIVIAGAIISAVLNLVIRK